MERSGLQSQLFFYLANFVLTSLACSAPLLQAHFCTRLERIDEWSGLYLHERTNDGMVFDDLGWWVESDGMGWDGMVGLGRWLVTL